MATTQNSKNKFIEKRKEYEEKLSNLDWKSALELTELNIKKEKLVKWKQILDTLTGLIDKRTEKAAKIMKMINAWKDLIEAKSEIDEVNKINLDIKDAKETLKSIEINNETISKSIVAILWEDVSKETISETINNFDDEIEKTDNEITENKDGSKKHDELKVKYENLISYIDRYLDWSKEIDRTDDMEALLQPDIVYQEAIKSWNNEVVNKMEKRALTSNEYENLLIEINPLLWYLLHQINISDSDSDKYEYVKLFDSLERWNISKKDKDELEEEAMERLLLRSAKKPAEIKEQEGIEDTKTEPVNEVEVKSEDENKKTKKETEKKEKTYNFSDLLSKIPSYLKDKATKNTENAAIIIVNFQLLDNDEERNQYIDEMRKKWWKMLIERNAVFKNYLHREENSLLEKQLDWVFKTSDEYEKFKNTLNDSNFAEKLINDWKINFLQNHLKHFINLTTDTLKGLIDNGVDVNIILQNRKSFSIELNDFLIILLNWGLKWEQITANVKWMNALNSSLAKVLISKWYDKELEKYIEEWKFNKLDSECTNILLNLNDEGKLFIAKHPDSFDLSNINIDKFSSETVQKLIDEWKYSDIIEIFKKIDFKDKQKYAEKLIYDIWSSWCSLLASNLSKINGLNHNVIAKKIFGKEPSALVSNLHEFKDLDSKIANQLIKSGFDVELAQNLASFKATKLNDIIQKLINQREKTWKIWENFESLRSYMNDLKLIKQLLWQRKELPKFLSESWILWSLKDLDTEIAEAINKQTWSWNLVIKNISSFDRLSHKNIFDLIMASWEYELLAKRINWFKWLEENQRLILANKLIESDMYDTLAENMSKFWFTHETQKNIMWEFIKKDKSAIIYRNSNQFTEIPTPTRVKMRKSIEDWKDLIITPSWDIEIKWALRRDFENFSKKEIAEYIWNPKWSLKEIFYSIPIIKNEYRSEVIIQLMHRNINTLKSYLNSIDVNEWKDDFNCLDSSVVSEIEKHDKEWEKWDDRWWFIIWNFEKFNVSDKKDLLDKAFKKAKSAYILSEVPKKLWYIIESLWTDETVDLLIKFWYWWIIAKNISKFDEDDHEKIMEELIRNKYYDEVLRYMDDFRWVDFKEATDRILVLKREFKDESEKNNTFSRISYEEIINNIENENEINFWWKPLRSLQLSKSEIKWIWDKLVELWKYDYLADNLDAFYKILDQEVALKLIENWKEYEVAKNPKAFNWKISKKITELLLEKKMAKVISENIEYFEWLNYEVAENLMKVRAYHKLCNNIKNFNSDIHKNIAEKLINNKTAWTLWAKDPSRYLMMFYKNFENLDDNEIIDQLIAAKKFAVISTHIDKFDWINHYDLAEKIIDNWWYKIVLSHLWNFTTQLEDKRRVIDLFTDEQLTEFSNRLWYYFDLDQLLAIRLISIWKSQQVAKHPDVFKWVLPERITKILIDEGHSNLIAKNVRYFKWLNYDIAVKSNEPLKVAQFIENFNVEDHDKIAQYLLDNNHWSFLASNFSKFKLIQKDSIAKQLIDKGYWPWLVVLTDWKIEKWKSFVAEYLRKFLREYQRMNPSIFVENRAELSEKFTEFSWVHFFPSTWRQLITILGWKPGCNKIWYYRELLKWKKEGDKYYIEYIRQRTSDEIAEVLTGEDKEEIIEEEPVITEKQEDISLVELIKEELQKWNINQKFIDLVTDENEWVIEYSKIKEVLNEVNNDNEIEKLDIDFVCEIMDESWVIINWWEENEQEPIEYTKENLWEIQKRLWLTNKSWNSLKKRINDKWEITIDSLTEWMNNNTSALNNFLNKLQNVWISIQEVNSVKQPIENPEGFMEQFEELWFTFKKEDTFLENLKWALIADPDLKDQLKEFIRKIWEYQKDPKNISNPIDLIESKTNKNSDFFAIKFRTNKNPPRLIIDRDGKTILTIVNHDVYNGIWWKSWYKLEKLQGIEKRKYW